jgi:hypothetical protein
MKFTGSVARLVIAGSLVAILGGCGTQSPELTAAHRVAATNKTTNQPAKNQHAGSAPNSETQTATSTSAQSQKKTDVRVASTEHPTKKLPGPAPLKLDWKSTVPITIDLSNACVTPGGTVSFVATSEPDAPTMYQAMYADGQAGAEVPYGAGYGGNDQGHADKDGRYAAHWIVSPKTPVGPARLDVIVGTDTGWGYAKASFDVSEEC